MLRVLSDEELGQMVQLATAMVERLKAEPTTHPPLEERVDNNEEGASPA
jgi:hypothetical protein